MALPGAVEQRRLTGSRQIHLPTPSPRRLRRKVIAMRMEESFRTPHFYVHAEVDAALLAKVREEMLPIVEVTSG